MGNKILDGIKFGIGILIVFSTVAIVSAVGFHYADEILEGTFKGNYTFDGNVTIATGNDMCIEGGNCLTDSISWSEITGKPAGFSDNIDDIGSTTVNVLRVSHDLSTGGYHTVSCPAGYIATGCGSSGAVPSYAYPYDNTLTTCRCYGGDSSTCWANCLRIS